MQAILFLLLGCLPPLAAGPLAGVVYTSVLKQDKLSYLLPFWPLLLLLNFLTMFWVVTASGYWLPIASLSAFLLTPLAAIATIFVMLHEWRKFPTAIAVNKPIKRWFILGWVLIPLLQAGMFTLVLVYGPWLCKIGFVTCEAILK